MLYEDGASDWIRTSDSLLRRQVLYPTELQKREMVAPRGIEPTTYDLKGHRTSQLFDRAIAVYIYRKILKVKKKQV